MRSPARTPFLSVSLNGIIVRGKAGFVNKKQTISELTTISVISAFCQIISHFAALLAPPMLRFCRFVYVFMLHFCVYSNVFPDLHSKIASGHSSRMASRSIFAFTCIVGAYDSISASAYSKSAFIFSMIASAGSVSAPCGSFFASVSGSASACSVSAPCDSLSAPCGSFFASASGSASACSRSTPPGSEFPADYSPYASAIRAIILRFCTFSLRIPVE